MQVGSTVLALVAQSIWCGAFPSPLPHLSGKLFPLEEMSPEEKVLQQSSSSPSLSYGPSGMTTSTAPSSPPWRKLSISSLIAWEEWPFQLQVHLQTSKCIPFLCWLISAVMVFFGWSRSSAPLPLFWSFAYLFWLYSPVFLSLSLSLFSFCMFWGHFAFLLFNTNLPLSQKKKKKKIKCWRCLWPIESVSCIR